MIVVDEHIMDERAARELRIQQPAAQRAGRQDTGQQEDNRRQRGWGAPLAYYSAAISPLPPCRRSVVLPLSEVAVKGR